MRTEEVVSSPWLGPSVYARKKNGKFSNQKVSAIGGLRRWLRPRLG